MGLKAYLEKQNHWMATLDGDEILDVQQSNFFYTAQLCQLQAV